MFQGSFAYIEKFFQASFQDKGSSHEKAASEEAASLLSIDQFCQNDFICLLPDVVHPANPGQLILCFQLFIHAFCLDYLWDELFHSPSAGLVNFCQVLIKLTG